MLQRGYADAAEKVDALDLDDAAGLAKISVGVDGKLVGMSGVAMALAAAGFIDPVAGAVLQEGIDVAVILNALRALRQ